MVEPSKFPKGVEKSAMKDYRSKTNKDFSFVISDFKEVVENHGTMK